LGDTDEGAVYGTPGYMDPNSIVPKVSTAESYFEVGDSNTASHYHECLIFCNCPVEYKMFQFCLFHSSVEGCVYTELCNTTVLLPTAIPNPTINHHLSLITFKVGTFSANSLKL